MNDRPKLSVLDLAIVGEGSSHAEALAHSVDLARAVERLGYHRHWVAEHHNMPGIASSAPAVLAATLAAETERIRVGSGGVMLPNHVPLVVAEQFGMLEALHPGRIDLGIGRAPGTDGITAAALRRSVEALSDEDFPRQLAELIGFFRGEFPEGHPYNRITAVPGVGDQPEIWLLGSSGYSAQLAGMLGMRFSFAHHFMPRNTDAALELYRSNFRPSDQLSEPYAMVAVAAICADDDERARYLSGPCAALDGAPARRAADPLSDPRGGRGARLQPRRGAEHQRPVGLGHDRWPGYGAREARGVRRAHGRRRADDHDDGPRPRRPSPLLRADRRPVRPGRARRGRHRDYGGQMTTKAEFNAEEWDKIAEGPALAGLIVISSQRGGTIRESLAMAKVYREAQAKASSGDLLGELVQSAPTLNAKQFSSKEDLRTSGLEKVREAVRLVEEKATPEELDEYRTFAINVAQHAAEADKSGGFLGIGGERITGNEESALNEIAEALGTERPPAPANE